MTTATAPFRVGQTLLGPLFNEPMRVETVSAAGNSSWVVGLVGAQSERFRRVTMSEADLAADRGEGHRRHGRQRARLEWVEVTKVAHYRIGTQGLPGGGA